MRIRSPGKAISRYLSSFIILEGRDYGSYSYPDLLVSATPKRDIELWENSNKNLQEESSLMLTPRQMVDFWQLLCQGEKVYSGLGIKLDKQQIREILEKRMHHEEWLDARIDAKNKIIYYNHKLKGKELIAQNIEKIEDCLMETASVNLFDVNRQGIPTKPNKEGQRFAYDPPNGVARIINVSFKMQSGQRTINFSYYGGCGHRFRPAIIYE